MLSEQTDGLIPVGCTAEVSSRVHRPSWAIVPFKKKKKKRSSPPSAHLAFARYAWWPVKQCSLIFLAVHLHLSCLDNHSDHCEKGLCHCGFGMSVQQKLHWFLVSGFKPDFRTRLQEFAFCSHIYRINVGPPVPTSTPWSVVCLYWYLGSLETA